MMESFNQILLGLQVAAQPTNLLYCFVGVLLGTLIGVLPGIGPVATISILLPITFKIPPVAEFFRRLGHFLFHGIGDECGNDWPGTRQNAQQEPYNSPSRYWPSAPSPVSHGWEEVGDFSSENVLAHILFDVQENLGKTKEPHYQWD